MGNTTNHSIRRVRYDWRQRIRTDLALETTERFAQENTEIRGVEIQEDYDEEKDIRTTVVKIVTENGAKSHGAAAREPTLP